MDQEAFAPNKGRRFLKELFSWIKTIVLAVALALLLSRFVIANASVISGSMEDTVMTGDRVICSRLAYLFSGPERYDIILFEFPYGDEPVNYVKRVIGLPGETVEIIDGKVYIDGAAKPLTDSFTRETPRGNYGPYLVPEGHYFVLGDNRNNSSDSKSWSVPYLPKETLIGKALFSYYPRLEWFREIDA